jgi:hypothetical protein
MRIGIKNAAARLKLLHLGDNDIVIAISGPRGLGKSTLEVELIEAILGKEIDFKEYLVYSKADFLEAVKNKPDRSIIGNDEAISSLFKRDWQDKKQIEIVKILNMYRDKCHIIFLLLPNFWDFDTAIKSSLIFKWWIYVYKIGEAVVFQPDTNPFTTEVWNPKDNIKTWYKGHVYQSKNYLFNISWQDLPKKRYEEYKRVKAELRQYHYKKELEEAEEVGPTQKSMVLASWKARPGVELSVFVNDFLRANPKVDSSYIYDIIKEIREKPQTTSEGRI